MLLRTNTLSRTARSSPWALIPWAPQHVRVLSHTNALSRTALPSPWALIPWALAQCAHFALGSQPLGSIARLVLSSAHKLSGPWNDINVTAVTFKEVTLSDSRRREHHPGIGGVLLAFVAGLTHPSNLSMAALRQLLLEPGLTKAEAKTAKTRTKNGSIIPPVTGCDERLGLLASRG